MSVLLKSLKGKRELLSPDKKVKYEDTHIQFMSFYGGNKRGKSLQISLDKDHIQLDNENARILRTLLNEHFPDAS